MFFIFLSSGFFLGWSLGANDAANVFGSAVGTRMISFKKAAIIASIFVILGAVLQGHGTTETLGKLGNVNALGGAFTVALSAGLVVYLMTRNNLPVSTTQAIVGAIIGWNLFTGHQTNYNTLTEIVTTWVTSPILGAIFSAFLYIFARWSITKSKIHVISLDAWTRWGLIIVGAFGAYSLGANNIANVIGVFIGSAPNILLNFGLFMLDGKDLLLLLGGLSIAFGILTYSKKVMLTVGDGLMSLSSEAALVVVLSQALVLFMFSSSSLSLLLNKIGLPAIPLVPVSSSQVVVGAVIGIGLVKGIQEIKFKTLGYILLGWISTPIASGILSYFSLFFVQNVFELQVSKKMALSGLEQSVQNSSSGLHTSIDLFLPFILFIGTTAIAFSLAFINKQKKRRIQAEKEVLEKEFQITSARRALNDAELRAIQLENRSLNRNLDYKHNELVSFALNLVEYRQLISDIRSELKTILAENDSITKNTMLQSLMLKLGQQLSNNEMVQDFDHKVEDAHKSFITNLDDAFPGLTDKDKRLAKFLRMGFSSKEISVLLNISPKSVEINRYRLRKKLGLANGENMIEFIKRL